MRFVEFHVFPSCNFGGLMIYWHHKQTKTYSYEKEKLIMKLSNITDVQKFTAAVNACQGDVYLKSVEGDVFNLKSSLSQYIAVGRLIEESGDNLELFAQTREDEMLLLNMLSELGK